MANHFTEADGRQLAADMLREIAREWKAHDLSTVSDDDLDEARLNREPATVRRYLATIRKRRSSALERGFLCVLNEYLGGALNGCAMRPGGYDAHEEQRHG